jgi:GT2 family glycosyltransferase
LKAFIIVATKGRAKETCTLLDYLARQTYPIEKIIIVGSEAKDVENLENHPLAKDNVALIHTSNKPGLTIQRNVGLNALTPFTSHLDPTTWFVTFFDDDFRPADNWLENAADLLLSDSTLVGLSGWALGDGINLPNGISEDIAQQCLNGTLPPFQAAWFGKQKEVESLYGCNMAYRGNAASKLHFDENLPLYGWQEDIDFSSSARKFGKLIYNDKCKGVHLGVSSGRTSGVRFGYSQIANPLYLIKKGNMTYKFAWRLWRRNLASNLIRTITMNQTKDYKGRLYGNFLAFRDLLLCRCHPLRVLDI